jgi:transcriptional regulator with XRE-family HTH domain
MFRITIERENQRMSKSELGRRTGIAVSEICRLEYGKVYPYPGWRERIGKALQVDPNMLFEEVQ